MIKLIALSLSALFLTGCASTPSPEHLAHQGDWSQLGLLDGKRGNPERSEAELTTLHPLTGNSISDYHSAYLKGLETFCEPESGFYHGLSGRPYEGQCDNQENASELIKQWKDGLYEYDREEFERMTEGNDSLFYQSLFDSGS